MENRAITSNEPSEQISTKRWIYLDVCKIVAIFMIVVMNVSSGPWGTVEFMSGDWHMIGFFNVLSRFGIPLFFMMTGALLLNEEKEMPFKRLFGRHILRLVTAFLFWSVLNMVIYYFQKAPGGFFSFTIGGFLVGVLEGAPYVHYFIFLSISLYLLIPILRAIAQNMQACRYYLILWMIFAFVLPTLRKIPWLVPHLPQLAQDVLNQTLNAADRISPTLVINYAGYLLLGHYIHKTEYTTRKMALYLAGAVAMFIVAFVLTIHMSARDGANTEFFMGNFSLPVLCMAIGFMISMKVLLAKTWFSSTIYRATRFFSGVTFGIFLVHDVLRRQVGRFGVDAFLFTPVLSIPIFSVAIFVLSALIVYLLKKIPYIGKYIV
ncbi:acyltransferase family protein [Eubacteriales bacterium OttesenSCG-928-A19]|nr:acyltransferase family protein [Eubacteriales bacterium OttesenSCG-928-A19]